MEINLERGNRVFELPRLKHHRVDFAYKAHVNVVHQYFADSALNEAG